MKTIALFGIESKLYPLIDAAGMHGRGIKISQDLRDGHVVDLRIVSFYDKILSNQTVVATKKVSFVVNLRKEGEEWFRIDNKRLGYLHFHKKPNFNDHVPLSENMRLSELISLAFDHAREILKNNFDYTIVESEGFLGSAAVKKINNKGIVTNIDLVEAKK